jgi:hypothetical protein
MDALLHMVIRVRGNEAAWSYPSFLRERTYTPMSGVAGAMMARD